MGAMLVIAPSVQAVDRYANIKPLLIKAIDEGQARGELEGKWSKLFQQRFDTKKPLSAYVTTIKHYKEEGCRRLNIEYSIDDAVTTTGKRDKLVMNQGVNMCRDGNPPMESVDLNRTYDVFKPKAARQTVRP